MSLREMAIAAKGNGLAKNDSQWLPKWMETYARFVRQVDAQRVEISRELLIALLRQMRDSGKSAWVRLQVVRAVQFYQRFVLQCLDPDLDDVRIKLTEISKIQGDERRYGGMVCGATVGTVAGGPVGTAIGAVIGGSAGAIVAFLRWAIVN